MSAQVGYVGHHADHLVTPIEGNQALPGVGDPATWAPQDHAPAALRGAAAHHDDRDDDVARRQPLQLAAGERPPARVDTASSSWPRTRSPRARTNNRGFYGVFGGTGLRASPARPRAPTGRTPTTPRRSGARRSTTCATTSSSRPTTSCRSARARKWGSDWSASPTRILGGWKLGGIFQARTGLPITVTDGAEPLAAGRARRRAARTASATGSPRTRASRGLDRADRLTWLDINGFAGGGRSAPSATARSASRARRATRTSTSSLSKRFNIGGARRWSSASRRSTPSTTRASGRRRATSRDPNTFGLITEHRSARRAWSSWR